MIRSACCKVAVGLIFALPLALLTYALAQASAPRRASGPTDTPNCQDCHSQIQLGWERGTHSQALGDPAFKETWEGQGSPKECLACHTTGYDAATGSYQAEGVTCAACHDPVPANHPLAPASMSRAAAACGNCHRDTYSQWQSSQHGQSDLTCVSCHDPHGNTLRASDTSSLCASCHGTRVAAFGHTKHAEQGLTCTDCHIGEVTGQAGMGKGLRNHTFAVNLDKCNKCHAAELHSPSAAMLASPGSPTPAPPDSLSSGAPATARAEPEPVGPLGYAIFTGLIGLAFGIVLAPWLESGFHRLKRSERPKEVQL